MSHLGEIAKPAARLPTRSGCNERGCCGMIAETKAIAETKSLGKAKRAWAEASARS